MCGKKDDLMHVSAKVILQDNGCGTCSFRTRAIAGLECYISRDAFHYTAGLLISLLLLMPGSVHAQVSHPRIWLDSTTLTRLKALKNANDPTWTAMKADADSYASKTVEAYSVSNCKDGDICYTYEGFGWFSAIEPLALAYKITGNTTYSNQVKAIMNAMAAAGSAPCSVDSGYASRTAVVAFALGYDWIYDQLSSSDKTNFTAEVDACWTWVQANGYQWSSNQNPYGNYFGAHMLGYGLAALAVEGDDSNSASMQSAVLANFNSLVFPAFTSGVFSGGYAIESYNYGGNEFLRYLQYMKAMETAGKTDLFAMYISWGKTIIKNTIHEVRPDNFTITDEGSWTGALSQFVFPTFPYDMAGLMTGTTEGGWMLQLYNNWKNAPGLSAIPRGDYSITNFDLFLYNTGQNPVDFKQTEPTYFFSAIDNHTFTRTDWSSSAVMTTISGDIGNWADHQSHLGGHISITRGSDFLLINGGQWNGQGGIVFWNSPFDSDDLYPNWQRNTLFYWDGGAHCLGQGGNSEKYTGCQQFWPGPTLNTIYHKESVGWAFQKMQLVKAYQDNNFVTSMTDYWRSYVNISDISFVFDRVSAPSTSTRNLYWHTPTLTTNTPPGIATSIGISGTIASAVVGTSKLWIDTLLPASPTITQEQGRTTWTLSHGNLDSTNHFIVSDPNASSCSTNCLFLTVLAATASSVASMPTTSLISAGNFRGALYDDGVLPRVALFSANGTPQTKITYTAIYSSGVSGRHVITDLTPGTYTVSRDGAIVLTGQAVGSDGSLSFVISGGTTYSISYTGPLAEVSPPTGLAIAVH
jgi:hypothetical protein